MISVPRLSIQEVVAKQGDNIRKYLASHLYATSSNIAFDMARSGEFLLAVSEMEVVLSQLPGVEFDVIYGCWKLKRLNVAGE